MKNLFTRILYEIEEEKDLILALIIADSGSAPRGKGSAMLVAGTGQLMGTIGGGAVEKKSELRAMELIGLKQSEVHAYQLHQNNVEDIGMVCGGDVDVLFQFIDAHDPAWKKLAGLELKPGETRITALKAGRKYTPEEVKAILRSHGEGTDYDMTKGGTITPHRGQDAYSICNNVTVESTVFVFADDLNLLKMYRASPKPCCAPYTPWYPFRAE